MQILMQEQTVGTYLKNDINRFFHLLENMLIACVFFLHQFYPELFRSVFQFRMRNVLALLRPDPHWDSDRAATFWQIFLPYRTYLLMI
jgi:hypothetical protein